MNTVVKVPGNGDLMKANSTANLPGWSNWIEEFFNRELPSVFAQNFNTGITLPRVNITETADDFLVEMAVPGLQKSDFQIDIEKQVLCISSSLEVSEEQEGENYSRREFGYGSFKRSFTLPETVDDSKIKANYKGGILSIHLPKKEEARKKPARTITVS
jgi:HSP20 family protein